MRETIKNHILDGLNFYYNDKCATVVRSYGSEIVIESVRTAQEKRDFHNYIGGDDWVFKIYISLHRIRFTLQYEVVYDIELCDPAAEVDAKFYIGLINAFHRHKDDYFEFCYKVRKNPSSRKFETQRLFDSLNEARIRFDTRK